MSKDKGVTGPPGEVLRGREPERALLLAGWGFFLIWIAAVKLGDYGSGAVLIGAGIILLLHQGARRLFSLTAESRWLLLGIILLGSGLWKIMGTDLQIIPIMLFAAGVALLVSSWRGFSKEL